MQFAGFCILLLAIYEPLQIHAKKIVLVIPRQVRRSPAAPWKNGQHPSHYRKSTAQMNNDSHNRHPYFHQSNALHTGRATSLNKGLPFPHGGDDFDGEHDTVNHVRIPYSKDISHAISFGKGYIPFDTIKEGFTPTDQDRYAGKHSQYQNDHDYSSGNSFSSFGADYNNRAPGYQGDDPTSQFSSETSASGSGLGYDQNKYFAQRSIGRPLANLQHSTVNENKETVSKGSEYFKDNESQNLQGAIILPHGIPAATLGGSREGVVIRDSVILDAYHKKMQELTQNWPAMMAAIASGNPVTSGIANNPVVTAVQNQVQYSQAPQQYPQQYSQAPQQYPQQYSQVQQYSQQYNPQYQRPVQTQPLGLISNQSIRSLAFGTNPYQHQLQQTQQSGQFPAVPGAPLLPVPAALTSSTGWLPNIVPSKQGYSVKEDHMDHQASTAFNNALSTQTAALQIIPFNQAKLNSFGTLTHISHG